MITNWAKTKSGFAGLVVAGTILTGSIATAAAQPGNVNNQDNDRGNGYTVSQCADGNWQTFKNPDGSQKFKNQGQCVRYFRHSGDQDNEGRNGRNNFHFNFGQFFQNFWSWWQHIR